MCARFTRNLWKHHTNWQERTTLKRSSATMNANPNANSQFSYVCYRVYIVQFLARNWNMASVCEYIYIYIRAAYKHWHLFCTVYILDMVSYTVLCMIFIAVQTFIRTKFVYFDIGFTGAIKFSTWIINDSNCKTTQNPIQYNQKWKLPFQDDQ